MKDEAQSLDDLDAPQRPALEEYATYAMSLGWDPIPVWGVNSDGVCACHNGVQCRSQGKHPIQNDWQSRDRLTVKDVYTFFTLSGHPINIGLRTGVRSGFWALDIDPKDGGDQSLSELVGRHGALPATRTHRTGSGGVHYLFRIPPDFQPTNARGSLPRGIDVRGNGGFIVAPGSMTAVGEYRTSSTDEIADAPSWLLDLIRPKEFSQAIDKVPSVPFVELEPDAQERAKAYLEAALTGEVSRLVAMKAEAADDMSQYRGEPWNQGVYDVCCNLLEFAQSDWLPFDVSNIKQILLENAPTDNGFTMIDVMGRLSSAVNKVRGKAREMPMSITEDSWSMLTANATKRYIPKDDEGTAITRWPMQKWDQVGNVHRTLHMAAGRLVWVPEMSNWLECELDGTWRNLPVAQRDDTAAKWCARAMAAAAELEVDQYDDTPGKPSRAGEPGPSKRDKFLRFMEESNKVEMHTAVATQLRRRAADWGLEVSAREFDADPRVFACASGLIDLRTGDIRPIEQKDRVTKVSPVIFDAEQPIPHFQRFLETSHPDPEVRDFLQKVIGYSMLGDNPEQRMFIHHGSQTMNGKSVLMDVLKAILAGHMAPASEKTIIRQRALSAARIGQDMVDLIGPRLLMLNETAEGSHLDSEVVKSLTSGDLRADRAHRSGNQEYRVTGKIHLVTNHMPHITPDAAMRRRLTVIPWNESFESRADSGLPAKLAGELPGILAWMVQGAVRWHQDWASGTTGLQEPELCAAKLADFLEDEDEILIWIRDRTTPVEEDAPIATWAKVSALHDDYVSWRMQKRYNGQPLSPQMFGRRLTGKGIDAKQARFGDSVSKVRPLRLNQVPANTTSFFGSTS